MKTKQSKIKQSKKSNPKRPFIYIFLSSILCVFFIFFLITAILHKIPISFLSKPENPGLSIGLALASLALGIWLIRIGIIGIKKRKIQFFSMSHNMWEYGNLAILMGLVYLVFGIAMIKLSYLLTRFIFFNK